MRSRLDDMECGATALEQAQALGDRVGEVGFDWVEVSDALEKLREEVEELADEIGGGGPEARLGEELGDVFFAAAMVARKLGLNAEICLRGANDKFARRWRAIEQGLARGGRTAEQASLEEMETLWAEAKRRERGEGEGPT